uniref:HEPN domain-containing protein n=1 Tax=Caldiarchaeum subterraneum TaxID=311458 RepID=E6NBD9_CALS0|nr:conserved hypothetical protein [Candidatus Caldarchaeum subterraneum]
MAWGYGKHGLRRRGDSSNMPRMISGWAVMIQLLFFAQQSVEMLLKGLLVKRTGARPYTHSITEMLNTLSIIFQKEVPQDLLICASKLERHYAAARYPDTGVVDYACGG